MGSFYPLFLERKEDVLEENGVRTKISGDIESEVINTFYNTKRIFSNFHDFLEKSRENQ